VSISALNYVYDKVAGQYLPGRYPGEAAEKWTLPEDIRTDYGKLNSIIETKYSREYLKICAYYNKIFPALRTSGYITSTYNVPPFTAMEQERADTGTGISSNYTKQIGDQVVARLGTATFEPALLADVPTLEYIVYKDEVERLLRKDVRDEQQVRMTTEMFHDAMIVGYSHEFIDPVTDKLVKANDYEVGMFEPQYTNNDVKQMLYRNYSFPVTSLVPYLAGCDAATKEKIVEETDGKDWVDFKMYFDCPGKRCVITIGGNTLPDVDYPFDNVQMDTFAWDIGFSKVTSTSLFDLLYPTQRELNRVNNKIQQLIRLYKGALPVFNSSVDLAMKNITNGTGECLYVDSARPVDNLVTVINPTPLDPTLVATKTDLKTELYELAGLQQMTMDMENFRSAAAVIAADQFNDTVFQAQLAGIAQHVAKRFKTRVHYNAVMKRDTVTVEWEDVDKLIKGASLELKPVVMTNPLGTKATAEATEPDYKQMLLARTIIKVMRGKLNYEGLPYTVDKAAIKVMAALMMVKIEALNIEIPEGLERFMIAGFIDDLKKGVLQL
jgi:hypothetical protein